MQTSLSLHPSPVRPVGGASIGLRRLRRAPSDRDAAARVPGRAFVRPVPSSPEADRQAPNARSSSAGAVALQVIREGTGLAGLVLWGWACLRLLGAG